MPGALPKQMENLIKFLRECIFSFLMVIPSKYTVYLLPQLKSTVKWCLGYKTAIVKWEERYLLQTVIAINSQFYPPQNLNIFSRKNIWILLSFVKYTVKNDK